MSMRRQEKEIRERPVIDSIIRQSLVCRLGLSDGERPYIVPLCFGYQDDTLYFHGSHQGRKMDILRRNPNVCFEFDADLRVKEGVHPCFWGMQYRSILGFGIASLVEDPGEKRRALRVILMHYSDGTDFSFPEEMVRETAVIRVEIQGLSGKQSGWENLQADANPRD
jgi:uncharacterized protein